MPCIAPSLENYSSGGYALASEYRLELHSFAEVASAYPGSDATAQLYSELENLLIDYHQPGWDGYGAEGISLDAYRIAQRFIRSLPAGIPRPSLSADPDGCVTFSWRVSPRRLVLASVHPDYRIDYAALVGSAQNYGSEPFFDKFPTTLCDIIRRVYQV